MRPPRAPTKPEISTPIRPVSMSVEPGGCSPVRDRSSVYPAGQRQGTHRTG